jgi:acetyltransferase-like isoleucine patch superfamily enzyme
VSTTLPTGKGLIYAFKNLFWDLKHKHGRFDYLLFFIRNLPGNFGFALRSMLVSQQFESCGRDLIVHPGVRFRNIYRITVGDRVELGVDNFLQAGGGLTIGDRSLIGPGVKIWTINHRFDDISQAIADQGYDRMPVTIGNDVWIGANAFIMPGVELGKGCIVSAGAVVSAKKYPAYSIIAGNPARVIGNRKRESDHATDTK